MINYELGILIGIFGYVYTNILTDEEQIFNWLYNFLDQKLVKYRWLFHVLIHCEKCFSGQLALWLFFYYNLNDYVFNFKLDLILRHLFFISFTILIAEFTKQIHRIIKTQKNGN